MTEEWSFKVQASTILAFVGWRPLPIVVSISACHSEDVGSIPGQGGLFCFVFVFFLSYVTELWSGHLLVFKNHYTTIVIAASIVL